jgi:hypothetical protein
MRWTHCRPIERWRGCGTCLSTFTHCDRVVWLLLPFDRKLFSNYIDDNTGHLDCVYKIEWSFDSIFYYVFLYCRLDFYKNIWIQSSDERTTTRQCKSIFCTSHGHLKPSSGYKQSRILVNSKSEIIIMLLLSIHMMLNFI